MSNFKTEIEKYYPGVNCKRRDFGKEYYQIFDSRGTMLGQGKTKLAAWKAAYRNIND